MATFSVAAEIWKQLEGILSDQARALTTDIARHQNTDPKELWLKVRKQIKVELTNTEVPDENPIYCPYLLGTAEGAVQQRCRQPCLLGWSSCPKHVSAPESSPTGLQTVDRIMDYCNTTYFVDTNGIAMDMNGKPKGIVKEGVLYLFEKQETAGHLGEAAKA